MCSIGGFLTSKPLDSWTASALARALLFYGQSRGQQSAGVLYGTRLLKKAVSPARLPDSPEWSSIFEEEANICLTHTRHPTSGGRGDPQAQPFLHDTVATVHNGWFINLAELKKSFAIDKPSGVDSELACRYVQAFGPESLPDFIKAAIGSSAIACKHSDALYLIRSGNPLCYCFLTLTDNTKIFFFASEPTQLARAIRYVFLIDDLTIKELKEGLLFRASPTALEQISDTPVSHASYLRTYSGRWDTDNDFGCAKADKWYTPKSNKEIDEEEEKEEEDDDRWNMSVYGYEDPLDFVANQYLTEEEYVEFLDLRDNPIPEGASRLDALSQKAWRDALADGLMKQDVEAWFK